MMKVSSVDAQTIDQILVCLKSESSQLARQASLTKLRAYSRDPNNPIHSRVLAISGYAFTPTTEVYERREALRCVCNTLLLKPQSRQSFADARYPQQAADVLKTSQESDDEFLLCRILFLLTYDTRFDFGILFDQYCLTESINQHIARHGQSKPSFAGTEAAGLSETLKLLFNLTNFYPKSTPFFDPSVSIILECLMAWPDAEKPMEPPVNYIINALVNLDLSLESCTVAIVTRLIYLLDRASSAYRSDELDTYTVPILTVLRKVYALTSGVKDEDTALELQNTMQRRLLPNEADRDLPIGQSDSLASRLLRLTTSISTSLREGVSSLMFELSGKDANEFIRNVGYGFAVGYLVSHDLPVPIDASTNGSRHDTVPINPVTGQRLDKEPVGEIPEMTNEQKEQEAERLFVLFERLRATGVVNVENPIRQAVEEGRFEEIHDPD